MKFFKILKRVIINSDQSNASLAAIVAGTANQSELLNDRLGALIRRSDEQSRLLSSKFSEIIEQLDTLVEIQRAEMELMRLILVGIASADPDLILRSRRNVLYPPAGALMRQIRWVEIGIFL